MKKIISLIITLYTLFSLSAVADSNVTVYINGEKLVSDTPAMIYNNRTMVPLRAIFETLGADVDWDGNAQRVIATTAATEVVATIGKTTMYVNGEAKTMDVAPVIINGRTLVPARFVAEAFGCSVDWDGNTKSVKITKGKVICTAVDGKGDIEELFDDKITEWHADLEKDNAYFIFKTNIPISPSNYTIVSPSSLTNSWNPKSWVLYGCNSSSTPDRNSSKWEVIHTVTNDNKMKEENKPYRYFITNKTPEYSYFKIEITKSHHIYGLVGMTEFAISETDDDHEFFTKYQTSSNNTSDNSSSSEEKTFVDKGITTEATGTKTIFDGWTYELGVGEHFILKNPKVPYGTYYAYTWYVTEGDSSCVELDKTYEGTCKVTALKPGEIKITAGFDQTTVNIGYNATHDSDERTAIIRIVDNTGNNDSGSSYTPSYNGYNTTKCSTCNGTGKKTCYTCNGTGTLTTKVTVPNYAGSTSGGGTSYESKTCPNVLCNGGKVDCMSCGGDGKI